MYIHIFLYHVYIYLYIPMFIHICHMYTFFFLFLVFQKSNHITMDMFTGSHMLIIVRMIRSGWAVWQRRYCPDSLANLMGCALGPIQITKNHRKFSLEPGTAQPALERYYLLGGSFLELWVFIFPVKWGAKGRPRVSQPHTRLPQSVFPLSSVGW